MGTLFLYTSDTPHNMNHLKKRKELSIGSIVHVNCHLFHTSNASIVIGVSSSTPPFYLQNQKRYVVRVAVFLEDPKICSQ